MKKCAKELKEEAKKANLDEGALGPFAFALMKLTATEEARIGALVKKGVS
jgi:hypothetical protein